jgi:4-hydroxy-tetrahydrodipicolinate synthase
MTIKIRGAVPVLHTPINVEGAVDEAGLERLVDYLVQKPIGGLWVLGTGGEDMNLTYAQRLAVARRVVAANQGRVPLVMGAGFFCMDDSLAFMRDLAKLDVAAIHVMPYHPLFSLDRLAWFYKKLADESPRPLWMYTSANWCRHIPPEFVAAMKGYPNIAGVKYSTSNAVHIGKVAALADENFNVLAAVVSTFYSSLCLGVDGATSSVGSPLPEAMIEIYDHFKAGQHAEALLAQRKLNEFLDAWPKGPAKDNFLKGAEEKSILFMRGICERYTTSYYRDCTDEEVAQLRVAVERYYPQLLPKDG